MVETALTLSAESRTRAAKAVSPGGNFSVGVTMAQYCIVLLGSTK